MLRFVLLRSLAVATAVLAMAGCASVGGKGGSYGPAEQTRAEELLANLKTSVSAGQHDKAATTAEELINSYPRFGHLDEVYFLAGKNADAQNRHAQAAAYYDHLSSQYETSQFRAQALAAAADDYAKLNDSYREAERLLMLDASPLDQKTRDANSRRLQTVSQEELTASQVDELAHKYPHSALARDSLYRQARAAYANGDYDKSYELVSAYLEQVPKESAGDAQRLLENASERRKTPPPGPATRVSADRIGLIFRKPDRWRFTDACSSRARRRPSTSTTRKRRTTCHWWKRTRVEALSMPSRVCASWSWKTAPSPSWATCSRSPPSRARSSAMHGARRLYHRS